MNIDPKEITFAVIVFAIGFGGWRFLRALFIRLGADDGWITKFLDAHLDSMRRSAEALEKIEKAFDSDLPNSLYSVIERVENDLQQLRQEVRTQGENMEKLANEVRQSKRLPPP